MRNLQAHEQKLVAALARVYYQAVPAHLRTYCAVTSEVSCRVLAHFGLDARMIPCQLWYMGPGRNHVIGFSRGGKPTGKWDGHVVCGVGQFIVDAALLSLRTDCGVKTPDVVVAGRFEVPTQFISRVDIGAQDRLLWTLPPPGCEATPPAEPESIVESLSSALLARLRREPEAAAFAEAEPVMSLAGFGRPSIRPAQLALA